MNIYNDFLSREEIEFITQCKQKSRIVEQLNKMGIPHVTNAHGYPVVRRDYAQSKNKATKVRPANEPELIPKVLQQTA
ncbi:DUF4224 domain-containing protein [Actinobacillus porcinus]|uniref:DUF4224 domain-containing protein n=1 Tax=Actinobacillus porcinus TaxID=51048 RepID=UPI0023522FB7|nr:DUF4224 domain-containing protein [Actinobacillus porcinus]MDD7545358.1 DUF4224 domain-containing protein [Actinobacillus porcinus]MDY5848724.1 DUF4224 domain-containing protein [Actinobacillus porcinus]